MKGFLTQFVSELSAIRRTPAAMSTMVVAVLVYAAFYPQPYLNEAVKDVPTVIIDQDYSQTSRALARRVDGAEGSKILESVNGIDVAKSLILSRKASAAFVIPHNFERDLLAGRQSPIAAYGDGSYFLVYRQAISAISGAARSIGAAAASHRLIAGGVEPNVARSMIDPMPVTAIPLFNPQGGYASYVVPAALVLILQQTLLMGVIILNAPRGRLDGLSRLREPMLPKVLAYVFLYALWAILYLFALPHFYDLPRLGSGIDTLLLVIPFLTATSFLGLFISRLVPNQEVGILLFVVLGIPLFFVAGAAWPIETMSPAVRYPALLLPSSSAVRALVQINQMGATISDVRHAVSVLWGLTGLFAILAFSVRFIRRAF